MSSRVSNHYDRAYFEWQRPIGEFGGWAGLSKFAAYIPANSIVLDFGCGGGFLLKELHCRERIGVEVNEFAAETARQKGVEVHFQTEQVQDESVDVIISDNALEHTLQPLEELKLLFRKLKPGGKIVFVVPCESIRRKYIPNDINHHLYTWSPMCLGNLFTEAGFSVIESKAYISKWPPLYRLVAKIGGRKVFEALCRLFGEIQRRSFEVRVIAIKQDKIKTVQ